MNEKNSWELTPHQMNEIKMNNPIQKLYEYNKFVMQQEEEFVKVMNFVNNIINDLIENREITSFTQVRARIKSQKSVLQNDLRKAVDDVFGMEIVTATKPEYDKVIAELKKWMSVSAFKEPKVHNKPNGYKATHIPMVLKKEYIDKVGIREEQYEEIPMIEFQFKTIETMIKASKGEAAHTKYKGEDLGEIQRRYDAGEFSSGGSGIFDLPTMWKSDNGKMRLLNTEEVLEAMYPYLKMKSKQIINNEGESR